VRYQYAPLEVIVQQVKSLLQLHGFSYTVDAEVEPGLVRATCKATHQAGHSQTSTFSVPIDKDAFMNPAQQCASALTFAKRYAFVNAFGILTGDEDDDSISSHDKDKSQTKQHQQPAHAAGRGTSNVPQSKSKPSAPSAKEPPQATDKTRAWFLDEMRKRFNDETLLRWGRGRSDPSTLADFDDGIDDWPLHQVPTTKEDLNAMILECADFTGVQPTSQRPAEPPQKPTAPAKTEPAHHSEDWYCFEVPFGKDKGTPLGELDKKTLFGWWANFEVEHEYKGKPKKPETIEQDERFRAMLDQAGAFYKFEEPA